MLAKMAGNLIEKLDQPMLQLNGMLYNKLYMVNVSQTRYTGK